MTDVTVRALSRPEGVYERTTTTLKRIATTPGKRATQPAKSMAMETKRFKEHVRELKELGRTENLKVGHRLSPWGKILFDRLKF